MGRGIQADDVHEISSLGFNEWEDLQENDPGTFLSDASAYEFADRFPETDSSNLNLNSNSSVYFDYRTGDYTGVGDVGLKAA